MQWNLSVVKLLQTYEKNHILLPLEMQHTSPLSSLEDHPKLINKKSTGYSFSADGQFESSNWLIFCCIRQVE